MDVSANYCLGPFGWPQGAVAAERGLLNLGLNAQLAGFQWVQMHIRILGGDPGGDPDKMIWPSISKHIAILNGSIFKVTIIGERAGSIFITDARYIGFSCPLLPGPSRLMDSGVWLPERAPSLQRLQPPICLGHLRGERP